MKLRTAQRALETKILGVTLRGKKTAVWIRERTGVAGIRVDTKRERRGAGQAT